MASLLSGLGQGATGAMSGLGSAAKSANAFMGQDIGGMTGAGVGATGVNWAQLLKAAQSGGTAQGMMPLMASKQKDGDMDDILSIASLFLGGV